jgi:uncharacterized protein with HEPN domain
VSGRRASLFLADILAAINAVERFTAEMNFEQFYHDEKTIRAVERELEIIGEAVKKIPEHIVKAHPSVPWRAIAGMRDRLIHHYWDTEAEILWSTIEESLPELKVEIKRMIEISRKKM